MKKTNKKLKIFSFFSGSGFLDLGFEKNGFEIQLVNEYHLPFMEAYKYSRQKMDLTQPTFGYFNIDVNKFLSEKKEVLINAMSEAKSDGSLVGFIGGPPCPDFSIAGKNRGRDGDNGKLSLSYVQLIIEMKPDFFLFENVKGLWRTARHREFFEELKEKIHHAGYSTTERLTNALEYGAPQDRDRILLFGVKKELVNKHRKGNTLLDFNWQKYQKYNLAEIQSYIWPDKNEFHADIKTECPNDIPKELTVEYWFKKNDVEHHPNTKDYFTPRAGLSKMKEIEEGDDSKKSYKRLHRWRYSPTVAYGNNEVHLHPYKVRRISVAEALALQTLPKEFELPAEMTLTNKFKTIGNGVPFLLSSGIAKTIRDYLNELEIYNENIQ